MFSILTKSPKINSYKFIKRYTRYYVFFSSFFFLKMKWSNTVSLLITRGLPESLLLQDHGGSLLFWQTHCAAQDAVRFK